MWIVPVGFALIYAWISIRWATQLAEQRGESNERVIAFYAISFYIVGIVMIVGTLFLVVGI
jgi:hypothetical protein